MSGKRWLCGTLEGTFPQLKCRGSVLAESVCNNTKEKEKKMRFIHQKREERKMVKIAIEIELLKIKELENGHNIVLDHVIIYPERSRINYDKEITPTINVARKKKGRLKKVRLKVIRANETNEETD